MAKIDNRELTKICINLPTPLVKKVKRYASVKGLPITQAYTILLDKALENDMISNNMPKMLEAFKLLQNIDNVDFNNLKKLCDIENKKI